MKLRKLVVLTLAFIMVLGTMTAYGYSHKLTIYPGNKGSIGDYSKSGQIVEVKDNKITVDGKDTGYKLKDKKYYVRGIKVAGRDNDLNYQTVNVADYDEDVELVVAYGIKGEMVKYTVQYLDASGNELLPSEEYYGMPGDKPAVSCKYVDGYLPQAFAAAKTLTDNEGDNIIKFNYREATPEEIEQYETVYVTRTRTVDGGTVAAAGTTAGGAGAAGGAAGGAAAGGGTAPAPVAGAGDGDGTTTIGGNDTPRTDAPDTIDDQDSPQANTPDGTDINGNESPKAEGNGPSPLLIGGVGIVAVLALLAWFLSRKRKNDEA